MQRQGEFAVVGAFSALDAQTFAQLGEYVAGTFDVAGGAQANRNFIFAFGVQSKLRIESGNAVDFLQRDLQMLCDQLLDLDRKIAVNFLRALQDRH